MELLKNLNGSRVTSVTPVSDISQPVYYDDSQIDPFSDVIDLESIMSQNKTTFNDYNHIPYARDVLTTILFALDGTIQLLSKEDKQRRLKSFVSSLCDYLHSNDLVKMPDRKKKIVKKQLSKLSLNIVISNELLEFMSTYLQAAISLYMPNNDTSMEIGWDAADYGILLCHKHGGVLLEEGTSSRTRHDGLRVISKSQKNELLMRLK